MISGIIFSACSGALLFVLFIILQKAVLGTAPLMLRELIVPVLFGAVAGGLIGKYYIHAKELNAELNSNVNMLEDLLSICANCKKIQLPDSDPKKMESWIQIESYISDKTSTRFSHSLCPECLQKLYGYTVTEDHQFYHQSDDPSHQ